MLDYLIVGLGLAGVSFCEQLEKNGKEYMVINDDSQISSKVAGGLYNPVILKRFTMAWMAKHQLDMAMPFYKELEKKLSVELNDKIPVWRRFASVEEQNLWFEATDRLGLNLFLSTDLHPNNNKSIDAPYDYGEVLGTGRIDTEKLLSSYSRYLVENGRLISETMNHDVLQVDEDYVVYMDIKARRIVFAEGYGMKQNPYFNYLPLNGTKGELLTIKAPDLKENKVIKSSVFTIPLGNDLYRVGATYKWKDKSNRPTKAAKQELLEKLDTFVHCDYEVVDHVAGIRPTVTDRRPLVGSHPECANMYVLNGFGSRGVLIAPYASEQLYLYIEKNKSLNPEMDISRFKKKYYDI